MIYVDWPDLYDGHPSVGLCGKLTCGHFTSPCSPRSSTWDFIHEAHVCPVCLQERQFDPLLQSMMVNEDEVPTEDQTVNAQWQEWER